MHERYILLMKKAVMNGFLEALHISLVYQCYVYVQQSIPFLLFVSLFSKKHFQYLRDGISKPV